MGSHLSALWLFNLQHAQENNVVKLTLVFSANPSEQEGNTIHCPVNWVSRESRTTVKAVSHIFSSEGNPAREDRTMFQIYFAQLWQNTYHAHLDHFAREHWPCCATVPFKVRGKGKGLSYREMIELFYCLRGLPRSIYMLNESPGAR